MSQQVCKSCGQILQHLDKVKAIVYANYIQLSSNVHFALDRPTECEGLEHVDCDEPKGPKGD